MKAILLAGGYGTRLRPITDTIPKCLVEIQGKPLLDYWLELLLQGEIDQVLINTHYLANLVEQHIEQSCWQDKILLVHEETLLGTAGTLKANASFCNDGSVFIAHADNLARFDLSDFIECHKARPEGVHITMMTFDTDTPESCGIVEQAEKNIVVAFHEKVKNPPSRRANGAVYIFDEIALKEVLTSSPEVTDISLDVIPDFMSRIQTYHNLDYLRDIGTPESLRQACETY